MVRTPYLRRGAIVVPSISVGRGMVISSRGVFINMIDPVFDTWISFGGIPGILVVNIKAWEVSCQDVLGRGLGLVGASKIFAISLKKSFKVGVI